MGGYLCGYCKLRHATVENVRSCAEKQREMILLKMRKPEPKAPVVDLDAYRKSRDASRRDLLSRKEINEEGIRKARRALRSVTIDDLGAT